MWSHQDRQVRAEAGTMRQTLIIVDDFFPYPHAVRNNIVMFPFTDYTSAVDGVTYPGISQHIPEWIKNITIAHVGAVMGIPLIASTMFARLTTSAVAEAPHKIHSDRVMGDFAAHIYLSVAWPSSSGTSFWTHRSQGEYHTEKTNPKIIDEDSNVLTQWERNYMIAGKFNRLLIHDANLWHCAEPVGGWGSTPEDGRLVLTTFFKKV